MRLGLATLIATLTVAAALAPSPAAQADDSSAPRVERHVVVQKLGSMDEAATLGATRIEVEVDGSTVRVHREPAPDHGWLGVLLAPADDGAEVLAVADGSPADRAGLRSGDVVLRVDGEAVTTTASLTGLLDERTVGDRVRVDALRDDRERSFRVRLAEQPADMVFELPPGRELPSGLAGHGLAMPPGSLDLEHAHRLQLVGKPRLGVQLSPLTDQLAEYFGVEPGHGILVKGIVPGTPAERAGLEAGDVLLRIGGQDVEGVDDVVAALDDFGDGDTVTLDVLRRGTSLVIEATLDTPAAETTSELSGHPREMQKRLAIVMHPDGGSAATVPAGVDVQSWTVSGVADGEPTTIDIEAIVTEALEGLDAERLGATGLSEERVREIMAAVSEGGASAGRVAVFVGEGDAEPQAVELGGPGMVWVQAGDGAEGAAGMKILTVGAEGCEPPPDWCVELMGAGGAWVL